MDRIEEFAVWLVASGGEDAATDDLNEGGDPLAERDDPLDRGEHRDACELALDITSAITANPEAFLAWYRSIRTEVTA